MAIYRSPRRTQKGPERAYLIKGRVDTNKTQQQVIDWIWEHRGVNLDRSSLASWESGRRAPAVDALHMLAECYGMSLDHVIEAEVKFLRQIGRTA